MPVVKSQTFSELSRDAEIALLLSQAATQYGGDYRETDRTKVLAAIIPASWVRVELIRLLAKRVVYQSVAAKLPYRKRPGPDFRPTPSIFVPGRSR